MEGILGKALEAEYKGISIDSRTIGPGEIFSRPERKPGSTGHEYIGEAIGKGAFFGGR